MTLPCILTMICCLAVSFLLSGMEAGVFALSRLRIRQQVRSGNPRARMLHHYLERPENFFWTILVGNTLASFVAVVLLAAGLHHWLGEWPVLLWIAFFAAIFLFFAWCDLLPKMLFRLFPTRLCLLASGPFRLIHLLVRPLVSVMAWLSSWLLRWSGGRKFTGRLFGNRDELRQVMLESGQGFTTEERAMINRVLDLQNLAVRAITIPMEKAEVAPADMRVRELLARARERHLTRMPVVEAENRARVIGLVNIRTLLYLPDLDLDQSVQHYVKPALYVDDEMRLEVALRQMQRTGQRLAIVLGRHRNEIGLVSLQDILKTIFGAVSL